MTATNHLLKANILRDVHAAAEIIKEGGAADLVVFPTHELLCMKVRDVDVFKNRM